MPAGLLDLLNLLVLLNDVDWLRWLCGVNHHRVRLLFVRLRLLLCGPSRLLRGVNRQRLERHLDNFLLRNREPVENRKGLAFWLSRLRKDSAPTEAQADDESLNG